MFFFFSTFITLFIILTHIFYYRYQLIVIAIIMITVPIFFWFSCAHAPLLSIILLLSYFIHLCENNLYNHLFFYTSIYLQYTKHLRYFVITPWLPPRKTFNSFYLIANSVILSLFQLENISKENMKMSGLHFIFMLNISFVVSL